MLVFALAVMAACAHASCPHASRHRLVGTSLPAGHPDLTDESQWFVDDGLLLVLCRSFNSLARMGSIPGARNEADPLVLLNQAFVRLF